MPEKTEAQKRAQKKYMSSFVEIKVRVTPEKRTTIQEHAQVMGESATTFINRAVDSQMERDGSQEVAGMPGGAVCIALPPDVLGTARTAAEAAGEAVGDFLARAVQTQVERDRLSRNS